MGICIILNDGVSWLHMVSTGCMALVGSMYPAGFLLHASQCLYVPCITGLYLMYWPLVAPGPFRLGGSALFSGQRRGLRGRIVDGGWGVRDPVPWWDCSCPECWPGWWQAPPVRGSWNWKSTGHGCYFETNLGREQGATYHHTPAPGMRYPILTLGLGRLERAP